MIKEVWYEMKGLELPESQRPMTGPVEKRIEELKKKMKDFEDDAHKMMATYNAKLSASSIVNSKPVEQPSQDVLAAKEEEKAALSKIKAQ